MIDNGFNREFFHESGPVANELSGVRSEMPAGEVVVQGSKDRPLIRA